MKIRIGNYDVQIDREELWRVKKFKYYPRTRRNHLCIQRYVKKGKSIRTPMLHREIMNCPPHLVTDHINGDTLDCRKKNLRNCTKRQNSQNQKAHAGSLSGLKGVSHHKQSGRWQAVINVNGTSRYLGLFATPIEAHEVYCYHAQKEFGQFARYA